MSIKNEHSLICEDLGIAQFEMNGKRSSRSCNIIIIFPLELTYDLFRVFFNSEPPSYELSNHQSTIADYCSTKIDYKQQQQKIK